MFRLAGEIFTTSGELVEAKTEVVEDLADILSRISQLLQGLTSGAGLAQVSQLDAYYLKEAFTSRRIGEFLLIFELGGTTVNII